MIRDAIKTTTPAVSQALVKEVRMRQVPIKAFKLEKLICQSYPFYVHNFAVECLRNLQSKQQ